LRALPKRCGVTQRTVAKWRKRSSASDLPTEPRDARSTVLTIEDKAVIDPRFGDRAEGLVATLERVFRKAGLSPGVSGRACA
jgi:hypothetical protein